MNTQVNKPLVAAAILLGFAALLHLGCILFGGDWYRFLGAGEQMAVMAEQGHWYPTVVTSIIVAVLTVWALYALSGAGAIKLLPLTKVALVLITSVFILRSTFFVALMPMFPGNSMTFWVVSSGICLIIGALFLVGTVQRWRTLIHTP